jgi:hypothetical protein
VSSSSVVVVVVGINVAANIKSEENFNANTINKLELKEHYLSILKHYLFRYYLFIGYVTVRVDKLDSHSYRNFVDYSTLFY